MRITLGLLLMLLGMAVACADGNRGAATNGSGDFVIPSDAKSIVRDKVGLSDQVLFTVRRNYPAFAFGQEMLDKLRGEGWKQCHSPSEEWTSFADVSGGSRITIHQKIVHFRKGDQVLVLVGRYKSPSASAGVARVPDSDQQIGNVSLVSGPDIDTALKVFNAHC